MKCNEMAGFASLLILDAFYTISPPSNSVVPVVELRNCVKNELIEVIVLCKHLTRCC